MANQSRRTCIAIGAFVVHETESAWSLQSLRIIYTICEATICIVPRPCILVNAHHTQSYLRMACFCSCIWGNPDPGPVRLQEMQQVLIDTTKMGKIDNWTDLRFSVLVSPSLSLSLTGVDCVVVKSGRRICGTGAALANAPLVQDKSYFEVKIQCGGE